MELGVQNSKLPANFNFSLDDDLVILDLATHSCHGV